MVSTVTETKLRQLQIGDRLRHYGVLWNICDYSTYTDPQGYATEEWLLKSETLKAYYLLREVDPANSENVTWYMAEELRNPTIVEPGSLTDLFLELAAEMRSDKTPYPELQVFNRVYLFESRTEGTYESDDQTTTRITWDYWDKPHLWNLALEAWSDRSLVVYSTREVQPTDFSDIQPASVGASPSSTSYPNSLDSRDPRTLQIVIASIITIVGLLLVMAGI